MSYNIALRVYQSSPARGFFHVVEQTVWNYANGGTWSQADGTRTLTMGGSGTSGVIRFMSDLDERIAVAVGVYNYERWCDIVTDLTANDTALVINGEYYNGGPRAYMMEEQLAKYSVTSPAGTTVEVNFTTTSGYDLAANIIFG